MAATHDGGMNVHDRPTPGLSLPALVLLALIAAPRVVLHDLGLIQEGTFVNALFVFVPPLVWIAVVLWRRVPDPFRTLLVVGVLYGVVLMLGHQLLWTVAHEGDPPTLGGDLADLSPLVQQVVIRVFAALSGLVTGAVVGAVCGLVAWGVSKALPEPATTR